MLDETTATFSCRTMKAEECDEYLRATNSRRHARGRIFGARYKFIEYMDSPKGLLVLAHRSDDHLVDGIHPSCISETVSAYGNVVPLGSADSGYALHVVSSRQQGSLVRESFGRMVDAGAPEAPSIRCNDGMLRLGVYLRETGPLVCVASRPDMVHVIESEAQPARSLARLASDGRDKEPSLREEIDAALDALAAHGINISPSDSGELLASIFSDEVGEDISNDIAASWLAELGRLIEKASPSDAHRLF